MEKRIATEILLQEQIMQENDRTCMEHLKLVNSQPLQIWERTNKHSDFLRLRLGTGTPTDNIEIDDNRIIYGGKGIIGIAAAKDNEMRIYSVTGQLIYSDIVDSNDFVISTRELGLKDGIYIVKLTNNENCITEKLKIRK